MSCAPSWARRLVGPLLLIVLVATLDPSTVLARLSSVHVGWAGLALLVGVAQTSLSAWRWRYTAGRLGLSLPFESALAEYYLATFLNQVLPGGVLGDATRAWRHADRAGQGGSRAGPAVRAVLLERTSGQVAMVLLAIFSVLVVLWRTSPVISIALAAAIGALVMLALWGRARTGSAPSHAGSAGSVLSRTLRDARRALWDRDALPVQLATSTLIVGSYVLTYVLAARAIGIGTPFVELAPLVAPVLLAMLIPLSVAGWGLREGAAAALWAAVGLGASEGVAISVAYGVIVALGTLPGAWFLAVGGYGRAAGAARRSRSNKTSSPSSK